MEGAERCLSDRKRKYMDTELAQDTEGRLIIRATCQRAQMLIFCLIHFVWCILIQCVCVCVCDLSADLFQDLIQLQEIWIAEGET